MTIIKERLGECQRCRFQFEYYDYVSTNGWHLEAAGQTIEEFWEEARRERTCPECGSEEIVDIEKPRSPPVTPHSGEEYMGAEHFAFFRDRLETTKQELLPQQATYFLEWLT